jgi:hypothetical protein
LRQLANSHLLHFATPKSICQTIFGISSRAGPWQLVNYPLYHKRKENFLVFFVLQALQVKNQPGSGISLAELLERPDRVPYSMERISE